MEIIFVKNKVSIDDNNWESAWQPKDKKQWKDGRSSKEFAKYASSDSFRVLISNILKECDIAEQDFVCEPEAKVSLGEGFSRGGCRNHDLLMIGNKDCVISVEVKVDESFDKKWIDALNEQKEKNEEKKTRAYLLRKYLTNGKNVDVDDIGYQLFTATRGTINSAIKEKKDKCIFLVIVFDGNILPEERHKEKVQKNHEDFVKFCEVIGATDQPLSFKDIQQCWIKKVTATI
ncbi:MAG: hypothetical protein J5767_14550 [Paludibacteraceae bacterium]|nr:hypothetical protein [Paludibacteraceae bacterium]